MKIKEKKNKSVFVCVSVGVGVGVDVLESAHVGTVLFGLLMAQVYLYYLYCSIFIERKKKIKLKY
jgi:hypothetical protein